jgi:DNA-binding beta-propeller fold protein YncE
MSRGGAKQPQTRTRRLRPAVAAAVSFTLLCPIVLPDLARGAKLSDQNRDGVVDIEDLILFSQDELGQDWQTVDWCQWLAAPHKKEKHLRELFDFIDEYFNCDGEDPLAIRNANTYPTRLAWGPDAQRIYVTDARVESVFIYDSALTLLGEIKGLGKPLGVAVDPLGNIYVGNNRFDNVEVYSPDGTKTATIGAGILQMPNHLAFDGAGRLYVADSKRNRVEVFDPATGANLSSIGVGELRFPVALAISGSELFVADQANYQVKVFDLQGTLLRALGGKSTQTFKFSWKGKFVRLQSVAIDGAGRLHALDCQMGRVQILNATTGAYITYYGSHGTGPGQLSVPLDLALSQYGEAAVANTKNERIELLTPP